MPVCRSDRLINQDCFRCFRGSYVEPNVLVRLSKVKKKIPNNAGIANGHFCVAIKKKIIIKIAVLVAR